jgi:flagellar protein FliS
MTHHKNPWQSYKKVAAQTATPGQLVLMLYDGAIAFLERGLAGFDYADHRQLILTVNNNILRAQAIIRELNARLDMDKGGEVAENFRRLYDYFHRRMNEANVKKTREPAEEVLKHLRVLRDSWAEMLQRGPNPANTAEQPEYAAFQAA